MGHNAVRGRQNQHSELTRGEKLVGPFLNIVQRAVEARGHNARLVETAQKVDNNFASAVIVNDLELTNISVLLHQAQEGNNDLGSRADEHLALSTALSVGDGLQGIGKGINENHFESAETCVKLNALGGSKIGVSKLVRESEAKNW